MVKHDNSIWLLTCSSEGWQFHITSDISWSKMAMSYTGGSRLSHTAVKPDSHLARIFVAKFFCIIKLIIVIG